MVHKFTKYKLMKQCEKVIYFLQLIYTAKYYILDQYGDYSMGDKLKYRTFSFYTLLMLNMYKCIQPVVWYNVLDCSSFWKIFE